ncbi:MAG TPA: TonB-dependent receptor [Allosphingosinicella sp.]|jgi:TonB-dependent receptor|nr:TonB-dependent receptor [Allosphingosinicella sp.]
MASAAKRDSGSRGEGDFASLLRCGASVFALCAFVAAAPAYAQTGPAGSDAAGATQPAEEEGAPATSVANSTDPDAVTDDSTIVVTGIRASLRNSQSIKRNSDTVVDAITAQDIGALPDRSVTEALQRVPGVAMNRFSASNDPDHFSVEGSGVVVRGLSFVRSEFNGRDTFSTGVYGQAINFQDVPAELLGSVEVYKNLTAEMIEGGLSGTVNMNLRLPFDTRNTDFHVGFDVEANYSDLAERWSPVGSVLVSKNFETGIGRIGLLGAFAYSKLLSRSDGIQITNFQLRNGTYSNTNAPGVGAGICRAPLPSGTDSQGFPPTIGNAVQNGPCFGAAPAGANGFADFLAGDVYTPLGGQFRTQDYDRRRKGFAGAAQWESLDRRALLTAQFLRAESVQKWGEHTFESAPDLSEYNTFPAGCAQNGNGPGGRPRAECRLNGSGQFVFNPNDNGIGYTPPTGTTYGNYQYNEDNVFESGFITLPGTGWRTASSGSNTTRIPTGGIQQSLSRRQVDDRNVVQDHGLNFKFTPNDQWQFNLDGQYVRATHDTTDLSVFGSTFADEELDLTGNLPTVIAHKPLTLSANWASPNPAMAAASDEQWFTNPMWTFWRAAMDHIEHSRGNEWAFKGDVSYNFADDMPFLKRVKFGARYSDRDQHIRYTTYNWGALSEIWQGSSPVFMDQTDPSRSTFYGYDNFMRGKTSGPPGGNYYSGDLIEGYQDAATFFKSVAAQWHANGASQTTWVPLSERPGVISGTDFLPTEVQDVGEEVKAAYVMLSFGKGDPIFGGSVTLDGNIGLRYVNTEVDSAGIIGVPTRQQLGIVSPFNVRCAPVIPPPPAPQVPTTPGGVCNIGEAAYAQLQQFATGETAASLASNKYDYFLPSLNLKFGLGRDLLLRFAASRALARPGMDQLRNFFTIGSDTSSGFRLTASSGNPFLKPALSDQFDASLEWYFKPGGVGSLTFNAFYKKIHNFFYQDVVPRQVTSGGVTEEVFIRGPANFDGSGTVKGFELAYQQTYDFLPGPLSGLGVQASYTYIDSKGLPQQDTFRAEGSPLGVQGNLPLEQMSKHNINVAAFYEKGPISLRAAYNWRSRFLLTSSDVIFPFFPIFNEKAGYLDASAFYSINKHIKVGVQGVNLLNTVTKTTQQFTQTGLLGPRSYFMNDRRFSFILRGSF